MLSSMTAEEFTSVLRPKVQGGWNLHQQFADKNLDFFILFSSVAALMVSPGQANYSAGNEFLDALARHRRALGLPGLSINWGPWGEVGMATQLDLVEFFVKRGHYPIANQKGLEAMGHVMGHGRPQIAISPVVWDTLCKNNYPLGEYPAMLDIVGAANEEEANNENQEENIIDRLKQTADAEERVAVLESHVQDLIARVLLLNRSKLTPDDSLTSLGLDSMLALEMKGRIEKSYGVAIAVVDLLRGPKITELANNLLEQMMLDVEVEEETAELMADLEDLTPEELERLLAEAAAAGDLE
jgi:acyl carrier protein